MRRRIAVKMSDAWYTQEEWRKLCDRLEAAWKRESGDCAKLREAAKAVVDVGYPHNFQHEAPHISGYCYDITRAIRKCFTALAAPPRNCDLPKVAEDPWRAWLDDKSNWEDGNPKLEIHDWLLAPATEKEGESNEQK
jgi:hypothetical protein